MGRNRPDNRNSTSEQSTFLTRLKRDQKGNALVIVAASIIPLVGTVGGGVDITRAYMAEARLAQACDAAALAGRKVMLDAHVSNGGAITSGTTTEQEIQRFIDYNFPAGMFNTGTITRTAVVDDEGELTITLATTMPTQMLQILGINTLTVDTECSARRSGVNVDVVLVLDTTGSMREDIGGGGSSNERIIALRAASAGFLEILDDLRDQLASSGLRVRVGIVPYATAVNVGHDLYDENASYIEATAAKYHSAMRTVYQSSGKYYHSSSSGSWNSGSGRYANEAGKISLDVSDFISKGRSEPDNAYGWRGCVEARSTVQTITGSETDFGTIPAGAWDITDTAPGVDGAPKFQPYLYLPQYSGIEYGPPSSTQSSATMWQFTAFPYVNTRVPYRVKTSTSTLAPYRSAVSNTTYASAPSSTEAPNYACSERVKLLGEYEAPDLTSYLDSLTPAGNTFHDVGMYWGLALISPQAPFTNPSTYLKPGFTGEERSVSRYIVFMTDGEMNANGTSYSSYGYENRPSDAGNNVTTTRSTNHNAHRVRFRMLCEAGKRQGIEISTVAFSTDIGATDQTALRGCATSADQYYQAASAADLNEAFRKIAQNIGYLRVSH